MMNAISFFFKINFICLAFLMVTPILTLADSEAVAAFALEDFRSILPQEEEERWLSIQWETNLMRARRDAVRLAKPLFIWNMDGNVLGST